MDIRVEPIAWVRSEKRKTAHDDHWGGARATIELDEAFAAEAIAGLEAFSHLEVVFYFHQVPDEKIRTGARHPRNREDWPKVGIFAQRGKGRPNRIGVSRCRLDSVEGRTLMVRDLDAIDGTPILDIKPWMAEFGPIGDTRQPPWSHALMTRYYATSVDADEDM